MGTRKVIDQVFKSNVIRRPSSKDTFTLQTIPFEQFGIAFGDTCMVFMNSVVMFNAYLTGGAGHHLVRYSCSLEKSVSLSYDPVASYPFGNNFSGSATPTKYAIAGSPRLSSLNNNGFGGGGVDQFDPEMTFQFRTGLSTNLPALCSGDYRPSTTSANANEVFTRFDMAAYSTTDVSATPNPTFININTSLYCNNGTGGTYGRSIAGNAVLDYACTTRVIIYQPEIYGA